jgi:hypothetical protein
MRKWIVGLILASSVGLGLALWFALRSTPEPHSEAIEVFPDGDIQAALDRAAARPTKATIRLHAGLYRPSAPNEALIHFNAQHDGIVLEGVGEVVLTAAIPEVAAPTSESFPAIVNHVVYFGDGVSERTVLRNLRITGANGYVQAPQDFAPIKTADDLVRESGFITAKSAIEPNAGIPKSHYFYTDGGASLIVGRSYPTIENVEVVDNKSSICAGGISIQNQPSALGGTISIRNCIFRNNTAGTSGSAVDLLTPGGSAVIDNCLFVGNLSDGRIVVPQNTRYGALSVFPNCRVLVRNCTFKVTLHMSVSAFVRLSSCGSWTCRINSHFPGPSRYTGLTDFPPFVIEVLANRRDRRWRWRRFRIHQLIGPWRSSAA